MQAEMRRIGAAIPRSFAPETISYAFSASLSGRCVATEGIIDTAPLQHSPRFHVVAEGMLRTKRMAAACAMGLSTMPRRVGATGSPGAPASNTSSPLTLSMRQSPAQLTTTLLEVAVL
jgi:hypothetical protein